MVYLGFKSTRCIFELVKLTTREPPPRNSTFGFFHLRLCDSIFQQQDNALIFGILISHSYFQPIRILKTSVIAWAGALVMWLWETVLVQEVVGVNPSTGYWMDIFHIDLLQKLFFLKKTENKQKRCC